MSTRPCLQCGWTGAPEARFCGQCGHTFAADPARPPRGRRVATTVDEATADPPAAAAEPASPPGAPPQRHLKTLVLGGHGAEAAPAAAPAAAPSAEALHPGQGAAPVARDPKRTMLGMPALQLPPPAEPPARLATPSARTKTMLGVAIPGVAPTHEEPPAARSRAGTLLGMALPEAAAEARAPRPAPVPPTAPAPPPPVVPAPAPLELEPLPAALSLPKRSGVPAVAVVAAVFVVVVLAGALALRSGAPITARPKLDESGVEALEIQCDSCPDGTVVSLGASTTTIAGHAAILPLPAPLSIGDNVLPMTLVRPGSGRTKTVKVFVPVAYRVKTDLSTLGAAPPTITVRVEAKPGAEVIVDGRPVTLDEGGHGAQTIDVADETLGPSREGTAISRDIPFSVALSGREREEGGTLVVRAGVVPMHLDAPGRELYTDRPTGNVAGQTKPGAIVTIDGQPAPVDADGRFGVRVELPVGEKTITIAASAPPLATRTARAKLVRVASLEAAAEELASRRPLGFDAYSDDPERRVGELAVVDGEVVELRALLGHTVLLIEEKKTCPAGGRACLVRVVHGEEVRATRGDAVRAFGLVAGSASAGGRSMPDIEGVLVVPAGKR